MNALYHMIGKFALCSTIGFFGPYPDIAWPFNFVAERTSGLLRQKMIVQVASQVLDRNKTLIALWSAFDAIVDVCHITRLCPLAPFQVRLCDLQDT